MSDLSVALGVRSGGQEVEAEGLGVLVGGQPESRQRNQVSATESNFTENQFNCGSKNFYSFLLMHTQP